ncbi:MAG: DegT/DnrJ/EryC1/StrS aminotransferase family protein [Geminicoccaceae bacterium]|nr:DegT/DnrJ/EryC1/StrS aminotransferase family protein [Geminicoccaceae bacterium]
MWPFFDDDERQAVDRVLRSGKVNYWTGEEGRAFEREFAAMCHAQHAIALANGTVALDLALEALDIGPGDEVVVTPRRFIASASCVVLRGARPVFADVEADSQAISARTIQPVLSSRTRAIIAVHLAGWPCEMDEIMALARGHGLHVIEDCAQAHGATYHGRPVGAIGDVGVFSFCQDKIMTTGGEGGMLVTQNEDLWRRAWAYKDHGKSFAAVYERDHPPGFRWLHESFGTNWRLTELQSAIGRVQLQKLERWVACRRRHAALLSEALGPLPALRVTVPPPHIGHAYYKYYAFVRPERLRPGWDRDRIMNAIVEQGVPCFTGSCSEMYLEKAFVDAGLGPPSALPTARALGETSLMWQVHPTLADDQVANAATVIRDVLEQATA